MITINHFPSLTRFCYLFSGQGAQKIEYLQDAFTKYPEFENNIKIAEKITALQLLKVFESGPQELLNETIYTQLFLFIYGYTLANILEKETQKIPTYLAGLSIGEYTALCYAGVFSFEDGIKLVYNRGRLMHQCCVQRKGTLLALLGSTIESVKKMCDHLSQYGIISISNINSDSQIVVGCEEKVVEKVMNCSRDFGIKKVVQLPVEGAFHTALMQEAGENLAYFIDRTSMENARIPVISNTTAKEEISFYEIKENLKKQITNPVLWYHSIIYLKEKECTHFIELGPGGILSDLVKRVYPQSQCYKINNLSDLENAIEAIKKF
jgi:[acyl-carrier-protein] S-malonyltransferase